MNTLRLSLAARAVWSYVAGSAVANALFYGALVISTDRGMPPPGEVLAMIALSLVVGSSLFGPALLLVLLFPRSVRERTGAWCLLGSVLFSLAALRLFGIGSSGEVIRVEYLGWLGALAVCASAAIFYLWNRRRPFPAIEPA